MYGYEARKLTKTNAFQYRCMKRTLKIRIGHIMGKNREEHCVTTLEWKSERRRKPGNRKQHGEGWSKRKVGRKTWANVKYVKALCALWHEEI